MVSSGSYYSTPIFFWQAITSVFVGVAVGMSSYLFTMKFSTARSQPPQAQVATFQAPKSSLPILPNLTKPITILVMGVDSNGPDCKRFIGTRSDVMIVVHLDPYANKVSLISIPRDSRVEVGSHGLTKINSAHAMGGPELSVATVAQSFSTQVDRHIVIDTAGLKKLCEFLGPVEVLVEKEMHYHDRTARLNIDLEPGLQVLDPAQTEGYVRFRHDARGDIGRIERQQWFLRQVAHKLKEPQVLLKLPQLYSFVHDNIVTDLTVDEMAQVLSFVKDIEPSQVQTAMLPGQGDMIGGVSYWVPDLDGCRIVFDRLMDTEIPLATSPLEPSALAADGRPVRVSIRYPRGQEESVKQLELLLENAGYKVRYKWQAGMADCQHEEIIDISARADQQTTENLRKNIPLLARWPLVVSPERASYDFTLVLSPNTVVPQVQLPKQSASQQVPVIPQ